MLCAVQTGLLIFPDERTAVLDELIGTCGVSTESVDLRVRAASLAQILLMRLRTFYTILLVSGGSSTVLGKLRITISGSNGQHAEHNERTHDTL
jgi:hypothetical protein